MNIKKWIKDNRTAIIIGLIVTVIGGLILWGTKTLIERTLSLDINSLIKKYLVMNYNFPAWLIIIFAIGWLAVLYLIGRWIYARTKDAKPKWTRYTQDVIFEILWEWGYLYDTNIIRDSLIHRCVKCKRRLIPNETSEYISGKKTVLQCAYGHFERVFPGVSYEMVIQAVMHEIDGRISSGDYRGHLDIDRVIKDTQEILKKSEDGQISGKENSDK
jgi:hypothetical protein